MDIRFLSTFLEVANTRHFGKAADNLYLTQSAVSARIKLLEEYFDVELFVRHRNSIQLTVAGERLIPFAQQLSENLQEAKKALAKTAITTIHCACTPNAYFTPVGQAIANLGNHIHDISVRNDLANIELISRQLHDHTIDIGFTTEPLKLDNVESIKLFELPLALFGHQHEQAERQYIHIEWNQKISDAVFKSCPEFKQSTLKTSSASIGLDQLLSHPNSCAILPKNIVSGNSTLSHKVGNLVQIESTFDVSLSVFLSVMQGIPQSEIEQITNYFKQIIP
ncbi:LysR family transcriptional regulator [Aliiglaciecola litoralis]|uniref:LysR family transcriptional regulator n=1 Tax=Aliiglaciecola litoralis TaxID=582857 RepID=A0ABN1LFA6_9ALTE